MKLRMLRCLLGTMHCGFLEESEILCVSQSQVSDITALRIVFQDSQAQDLEWFTRYGALRNFAPTAGNRKYFVCLSRRFLILLY